MKKHVLKKILSFLRPYTGWIVLSFLFATLSVAGTIAVPMIVKNIINLMVVGITHSLDWGKIWPQLEILIVLNMIVALTTWGMHLCNNRITFSFVKDIRCQAFEHLQKLPISYLDAHPSGDIVSRFVQDVDQLSDGLLLGFSQLFTGVLTILGTIGVMLVLNGYVAIAVIVLTPLSLLVTRFISRRSYHLFAKQGEEKGAQTAFLDEMIQNQKLVQAYAYEQEALRRFEEQNETLRKTSLKAIFYSSLTNPSTRFINNIIYAVVGVLCAFLAIHYELLDVGEVSAFLSYASQYGKPFNDISATFAELQNSFACAERVFALLEVPLEEDVSPIEIEEELHSFSIQNITFSYVEEQKLIENFSLDVHPGQRIAIVGPTGCGKTTLINLLMRFYDVKKGKIVLNGKNIQELSRKQLRSYYGMVLQDTWLTSGTIRENIMYGKPDATEEEVLEASKLAHCHSFIRRLEKGYDTVIGEEGGSLSQGQKQLLCIARVLLMHPPILILDEATSNIDTRTERKVQSAFQHLMEGKTSFIVAHRLSTIQNADLILVMKDGNIIEQGRHEELMQKQGFYYELYQSQFAK